MGARGYIRTLRTTGYKNPQFQATKLTLSKSSKVLDFRLNWLANTAVLLEKPDAALYACQKLVEECRGMKPSFFLWHFNACNENNGHCNFEGINTPICPRDLHIRKIAEVVLMRLKSLDSLGIAICRHTELVASVEHHLTTDYMVTQHIYEHNLRLIFPSILGGEQRRLHFEDLIIYTDGWKMDDGTGSGIYCEELGIRESYKMNSTCRIFQAVVFAKASELLDRQAARKALDNANITSKVFSRCHRELRALIEQHNITLCWVPDNYGIRGNEQQMCWLSKVHEAAITSLWTSIIHLLTLLRYGHTGMVKGPLFLAYSRRSTLQ
ncbi:uncharacterized protein LOC142224474 [Haematobia irritans]|uniref:uncharacterized protein LOC142224474 n=1 Tax=Haematobia irritans TaxID=7368 RepID=UPI003F50A9CB